MRCQEIVKEELCLCLCSDHKQEKMVIMSIADLIDDDRLRVRPGSPPYLGYNSPSPCSPPRACVGCTSGLLLLRSSYTSGQPVDVKSALCLSVRMSEQQFRAKNREKSSLLGMTCNGNIKKAVKALETLGTNVSNINAGKVFNFGTSSKGNKISILAFEVASTIAKGAALLESLSENHIELLKKEILCSEGVKQLVSTDMQELMSIAAANKREESDVFIREIIRFGELCKDPQWHNLSQYFLKVESGRFSNTIHTEEAETTMQELNSLARHTSELYHELNALDRFGQDYKHKCEEAESLNLHQEEIILTGEDLRILQDELRHRRQHIKSLKKKSLWSRNMEEIMVKLVDMAIYIHEQIVAAFGVSGLPSMKKVTEEPKKSSERLGEAGLALHYANMINQIDTIASHPDSFPPNARDMLYNGLPASVKKALKSQLQNVEANNQTQSISHVEAELQKTLKWLVPLAANTVKTHQEFGWIGEFTNIGKQSHGKLLTRYNLISLQTLHHADKEKADAYVLQLVVLLHNLISLVRQRVAFISPPVKSPIWQGVKSQYELRTLSSLVYSPGTPTHTVKTAVNRDEPSPGRSVPGASSSQKSRNINSMPSATSSEEPMSSVEIDDYTPDSLDLEENTELISDNEFLMVGKVIADRSLNKKRVMNVLENAWKKFGEVKISDEGANLFLFAFDNYSTVQAIQMECPWVVMGHCLVMEEWRADARVEDILLDSVVFWMQIHGLQLDHLSVNNANKMGAQAGLVIGVDPIKLANGLRRSFLRVRLKISASSPLKSGVWVNRKDGSKYWASFKYERLQEFCFNCGRLGHVMRACSHQRSKVEEYGPHLRAK